MGLGFRVVVVIFMFIFILFFEVLNLTALGLSYNTWGLVP